MGEAGVAAVVEVVVEAVVVLVGTVVEVEEEGGWRRGWAGVDQM